MSNRCKIALFTSTELININKLNHQVINTLLSSQLLQSGMGEGFPQQEVFITVSISR